MLLLFLCFFLSMFYQCEQAAILSHFIPYITSKLSIIECKWHFVGVEIHILNQVLEILFYVLITLNI